MSIDSISWGATAFTAGPSSGNPSTIYSTGEPLMEPSPLILTSVLLPGAPLLLTTSTPAARPCSASAAPATAVCIICSDSTFTIEPVTSSDSCVPYPTTTNSFNSSFFILTLSVVLLLTKNS